MMTCVEQMMHSALEVNVRRRPFDVEQRDTRHGCTDEILQPIKWRSSEGQAGVVITDLHEKLQNIKHVVLACFHQVGTSSREESIPLGQ